MVFSDRTYEKADISVHLGQIKTDREANMGEHALIFPQGYMNNCRHLAGTDVNRNAAVAGTSAPFGIHFYGGSQQFGSSQQEVNALNGEKGNSRYQSLSKAIESDSDEQIGRDRLEGS